MNKLIKFFECPENTAQLHYEMMKRVIVYKDSLDKIGKDFGCKSSYIKKLYSVYTDEIERGENPFFIKKKTGPQKPRTDETIIEEICILRRSGCAITDIQAMLDSKNIKLSLVGINGILKREGFERLKRRSREERHKSEIEEEIKAPKSVPLDFSKRDFFHSTKGGGILTLLPLLEKINIYKCIKEAGYPSTKQLSNVNYILSLLTLKLIGNKRYGHDDVWALDRGLGLFAGLNVLPKNASLSSYSYKTTRKMNRKFIKKVNEMIFPYFPESANFNLDFAAIPHWGDLSILENNWKGSKNKALKSVLTLLSQDADNGLLSYADAEIKHNNQNDGIIEFIDFWKDSHNGISPKCLIFDSKFTTYANLNKLNKDNIKFVTLKRRGKNIQNVIDKIPECDWEKVKINNVKRKYRNLKVYDSKIKLKDYEGEIRQILVTDNGREKPALIITNDFANILDEIILKYARRWLIEKSISEQIEFFHLNKLSSSIVIKVDLDLTLTLVANNIYRLLASYLPCYQKSQIHTLFNLFLDNSAQIEIKPKHNTINVSLLKKRHLPLLLNSNFIKSLSTISHLGNYSLKFSIQNKS